jgi:hypothetical protein
MEQDKKLKNFIKTTLRDFLNENINNNKNDIVDFIVTNSYFDYEGDDDGLLQFSTRKNGSVSNETASDLDIKEGRNIVSKLLKKYSDIDANIEVVDEWVLIFVSDIKEKKDIFRYIFIKDINGQGFSEGFDTMDELIDKYGDWVDVDWNDIKKIIDNIKTFNDNTFTGWYNSNRILIKKAGEDGNKWGYNFFIQKSKKTI